MSVFEKYVQSCPQDGLKKALYLLPKRVVRDAQLFTANPIGHNTLKNMVKSIMSQANIKGNFTNHSLRVTTATRLYQVGVSEQLISNQTGHRSDAVTKYKRPSLDQIQNISDVLQGNTKKIKLDTAAQVLPTSSSTPISVPTCSSSPMIINVNGGNVTFNITK